jgi:hypothetical protein
MMAGGKEKKSKPKAPGAVRSKNQNGANFNSTVEAENNKPVQEDTCRYCRTVFTGEVDPMVICERCEEYICISCANLTEEEYSFLQRTALHWFCSACEKPALSAVKSDKLIEEKCTALFSEFRAELQKELASVKEELAEMKAQLEASKSGRLFADVVREGGGSETATQNPNGLISELASQSSKEVSERERRKGNLIWFGVSESSAPEAKDRVAADSAFVGDVCQRVLGVKLEVATCRRLKSKDGEGENKLKCRPLLITVKDPSHVGQVLKNARKLRDNAEVKTVFVKKDATPLERAEMRKLVVLRDQKREETKSQGGNSVWVVRNGRVVDVSRRQEEGSRGDNP